MRRPFSVIPAFLNGHGQWKGNGFISSYYISISLPPLYPPILPDLPKSGKNKGNPRKFKEGRGWKKEGKKEMEPEKGRSAPTDGFKEGPFGGIDKKTADYKIILS